MASSTTTVLLEFLIKTNKTRFYIDDAITSSENIRLHLLLIVNNSGDSRDSPLPPLHGDEGQEQQQQDSLGAN